MTILNSNKNLFSKIVLFGIAIITLFLFFISIETYYDGYEISEQTTTRTETNTNYNQKTDSIEVIKVNSIEELNQYIAQSGEEYIYNPAIIIGETGQYLINGIDTGISSKGIALGKPVILLIENTSVEEKDEGLVKTYTILYSDLTKKTFKLDGDIIETNKDLDVNINQQGNWVIDGIDTNISVDDSQYEKFIQNNKEYRKTKIEWLSEIEEGKINLDQFKQYTCTVYPNNGEFPYSFTIFNGSTINEIKEPSRKGYKFIGWFDQNYQKVDLSKTIVINDITLHAIYQRLEYKINYKMNNSNLEDVTQAIHYLDNIELPNVNSSNLSFEGWYNLDGTKFNLSQYSIEKDTVLVAKWNFLYTLKIANSMIDFCNKSITIKDATISSGWYCDDMPVLLPRDQVKVGVISFLDRSNRASGEDSVINDILKLDIVGETKSRKTAMIQDLDYELEPRYYVRT